MRAPSLRRLRRTALRLVPRFGQGEEDPSPAEQLRMLEERVHIYGAVVRAMDDLPAVLRVIMDAEDPDDARRQLEATLGVDPVPANAILDLQLRRATVNDRRKMRQAHEELLGHLDRLRESIDPV